jgi:hypothetical protein
MSKRVYSLRSLREHGIRPSDVVLADEFIDKAGADDRRASPIMGPPTPPDNEA